MRVRTEWEMQSLEVLDSKSRGVSKFLLLLLLLELEQALRIHVIGHSQQSRLFHKINLKVMTVCPCLNKISLNFGWWRLQDMRIIR